MTEQDREGLRVTRGFLLGAVAGCCCWLLLAVIVAVLVLSGLWGAGPAR